MPPTHQIAQVVHGHFKRVSSQREFQVVRVDVLEVLLPDEPPGDLVHLQVTEKRPRETVETADL